MHDASVIERERSLCTACGRRRDGPDDEPVEMEAVLHLDELDCEALG
jgi:hypothetical protein